MNRLNDFNRYLEEKGLKVTHQREQIVGVFFEAGTHLSGEELYQRVKKRNPKVGYSTVYRTLKLLVKADLATQRQFGDGQSRFEPVSKKEHHDHLICLKCGRIIEFENDNIEKSQKQVAKKKDFEIVKHKLELYGYCRRCRE